MVFNPVDHGPGPLWPPDCDNRQRLTGLGLNYNPARHCSHTVFPHINAPLAPPPGRPAGFYNFQFCANVGTHHHLGGFTVCGKCVLHIEDQHWYKLASARMLRLPTNPPTNETNKWLGFWTRLCHDCEMSEQYLIHMRQGNIPTVGAVPIVGPATQALMRDYPFNTCTCYGKFDRWRLCIDHRRIRWDQIRTNAQATDAAGNDLAGVPLKTNGIPGLVLQRKINKEWLRTTARTPGGVLCMANAARLQQRWQCANNHILRACRCGEEVTTDPPEVYMCMVCQGIRQVTAMGLPWAIANPPPLGSIHLINHATPGRPLRIGRGRDETTFV